MADLLDHDNITIPDEYYGHHLSKFPDLILSLRFFQKVFCHTVFFHKDGRNNSQ